MLVRSQPDSPFLNMTKTIVLGAVESEAKKNPITFNRILRRDGSIKEVDGIGNIPYEYPYIELICLGYTNESGKKMDLMFAYNNPKFRNSGTLYLGKWNDGVV